LWSFRKAFLLSRIFALNRDAATSDLEKTDVCVQDIPHSQQVRRQSGLELS
jgi:hypothetical protein